ncbi:MAG: hypothetical protein IT259_03105 [Saprospiraceae bacterium]|nr:hypothetical protein [Saprospiraceae bacterium]
MRNLFLFLFLIKYSYSIGQVEIYTYVGDGQNVSVIQDSQGMSPVLFVIDNNENDPICRRKDEKWIIKTLFKNDTLCTFISYSYLEPFNSTDFYLYKKTNGYWRFLDFVCFDESPAGFRQISYQFNQTDILTFEVTKKIGMPAPKLTKYTYKYDGNGNLVVTETQL